jgi:hypothetical protein
MVGKVRKRPAFSPYLRTSVPTAAIRRFSSSDDSDMEDLESRLTKRYIEVIRQRSIDPMPFAKETENSGGVRYNTNSGGLRYDTADATDTEEPFPCRVNRESYFVHYDRQTGGISGYNTADEEPVPCRFNCGAYFDYFDIDALEDHEEDHVNILNL